MQPSKYSHLFQPIEDPQFTRRQLEVTVLRTDLLHPVISGNKWMKLQPWLQKATQLGCSGIISKGGPWSNHLHAAAYACQQQNLSFTAVVKARKDFMTAMLEDVLQWNGKIIYTDHALYNDEQYWENLAFVQDALYIPMGGEGNEGAAGVSAFFNELMPLTFDYLICPVGTGTTFRGIAGSHITFGEMIGIDPGINDKAYDDIIRELSLQKPGKKFRIIADNDLQKLGKWPLFLPAKMNEWQQGWNLPTDIIYTAKMCSIFEKLVAENYFKPGTQVLLVHTGGLQGNRSLPQGLLNY